MGSGIRRVRPAPVEKTEYEDDEPWDDTMRDNLGRTPIGRKVLNRYDQQVERDRSNYPEFFTNEEKNRRYPLPYNNADDSNKEHRQPAKAEEAKPSVSDPKDVRNPYEEDDTGFEADGDFADEFEDETFGGEE